MSKQPLRNRHRLYTTVLFNSPIHSLEILSDAESRCHSFSMNNPTVSPFLLLAPAASAACAAVEETHDACLAENTHLVRHRDLARHRGEHQTNRTSLPSGTGGRNSMTLSTPRVDRHIVDQFELQNLQLHMAASSMSLLLRDVELRLNRCVIVEHCSPTFNECCSKCQCYRIFGQYLCI